MLVFLKSTSRTVHHYHDHQQSDDEADNYNDEAAASTSLTVWTKSLLLNCGGFTVIASDGTLVFRVDNYSGRPEEVLLMDGSGNPIFTICRRKKLRLMDNYWLVYEGEAGAYTSSSKKTAPKEPVFCVRKNMSFRQTKTNVIAHVYSCGVSDERQTYTVEGSYRQRSCKILDDSRRIVGEIRKKEAMVGGASFGLEVFHLIVNPGFESGFAMAIVLLLHQMFS